MKTNFLKLLLLTFFTSCAIEEVPTVPLLATPLGLTVKTTTGAIGGGTGIGMFFTVNNIESYFTGYAIFVSTRMEDFATTPATIFPTRPTDVAGNQSFLLRNYATPTDTRLSIRSGPMSFPERRFYPPTPSELQLAPNTPEDNPNFTSSSFEELPDGSPFVSGTKYYFAVYAYSSLDDVLSLPSNIAELTFP